MSFYAHLCFNLLFAAPNSCTRIMFSRCGLVSHIRTRSTIRIHEAMTVSDLRAAVLAKSKAKISPECYGICAEKPSGIVELPSATPAFQVDAAATLAHSAHLPACLLSAFVKDILLYSYEGEREREARDVHLPPIYICLFVRTCLLVVHRGQRLFSNMPWHTCSPPPFFFFFSFYNIQHTTHNTQHTTAA